MNKPNPSQNQKPTNFSAQLDAMSSTLKKLLPPPDVAQAMARQETERIGLLLALPFMTSGTLNSFLVDFFSNDDLVATYCMPLEGAKRPGMPAPTPLELCVRAARKASYDSRLRPWEREIAATAVIVQPCGFFWRLHQELLHGAQLVSTRLLVKEIEEAREMFLADSLKQLRRLDPLMGNTLSRVLGLVDETDADENQLALIRDVMRDHAAAKHEHAALRCRATQLNLFGDSRGSACH